MATDAKEELALRRSRVARRGPNYFLQVTYVPSNGQSIGLTFHMHFGTPAKVCLGSCPLGAPAAIQNFLHRVIAGSDTAGYFGDYLAAAAMHPKGARPNGKGRMTLALTSAPNVGCCA